MMSRKLLLPFILLLSAYSYAEFDRSLGKSPRGLLMGDAYTALATEDFTLFYNPAILARHSGFSFYPLNPSITASNILSEPDRFTDIGDTTSAYADALFDFPVHIGVDYAPGLKMGRFGLSAIVNYNTNFILQNEVTPVLDVDHRFDKGFVAGYAAPLMENLSLGASVKYIKREAIYGSYNLTGYTLLDALSAGEIDDILQALGQVNGSGWGFDLGLDYHNESGAQAFSAGLVFQDIYTLLHTEDNDDDLEVQPQPMVVNFGTAWMATLGAGFDFTLSADIKHLEQQMELMRRIHLGVEVGLSPLLSVLAGVNAIDNYSYGVKLDTGLINVYAGFYTNEFGEKLSQQESNEIVVYVSLFDFNFEP